MLINLKKSLVSISNTGEVKWEINSLFSRKVPLVDQNGVIYVANEIEKTFIALLPNGKVKWIKSNISVVPSFISENGSIHYFDANSNGETFLNSINQEGEELWKIPLDPAMSSPAVSDDGTIYAIFQENICAMQS